jgi:glycosyltransferase involved in cell wall biosynthesis
MRIFTCTPVAFKGDHTFFSRESGLLSRGLASIGIDSTAVMPRPDYPQDERGLVRTTYPDLGKASWWKEHLVDAVVLFAWAMPQYTPIAQAIKDSGAKLMLYLDSAGVWNPWSDGSIWFSSYWNFTSRTYGSAIGIPRFTLGVLRHSIPRLFAIPRLQHMALADVIGTGSPGALRRTIKYANKFGFSGITERMVLSPPAIPEHFRYGGELKKKRILCIGRWRKQDWAQKNPALLLQSLASFLDRRRDYEAVVVGREATNLSKMGFCPSGLDKLPITFVDALPNADLTSLYKESRISLCSSYHESFHLASFEAACCGCSIVALDSEDVPALQWLAETDGTLAGTESPIAFSDALVAEAAEWERGSRIPGDIARRWTTELWASQTAKRVVRQLGFST